MAGPGSDRKAVLPDRRQLPSIGVRQSSRRSSVYAAHPWSRHPLCREWQPSRPRPPSRVLGLRRDHRRPPCWPAPRRRGRSLRFAELIQVVDSLRQTDLSPLVTLDSRDHLVNVGGPGEPGQLDYEVPLKGTAFGACPLHQAPMDVFGKVTDQNMRHGFHCISILQSPEPRPSPLGVLPVERRGLES